MTAVHISVTCMAYIDKMACIDKIIVTPPQSKRNQVSNGDIC